MNSGYCRQSLPGTLPAERVVSSVVDPRRNTGHAVGSDTLLCGSSQVFIGAHSLSGSAVMTDWDHYKKAYSEEWDAGARRERLVAETIERVGRSTRMEGLGAGSTEFISGPAREHGKARADPDILVVETETYVEVTGTNVGTVRPESDIFVRPDKFENPLSSSTEDHWLVHVLDGPALVRCLRLTDEVCRAFRDEGRSVDTQHDDNETYVRISPDARCIRPVTELLAHVAPDGEGQLETALTRSLVQWTTVPEITDGDRHSMALNLTGIDPWDGHDSIEGRLSLLDCDGNSVEMTVFENNAFTLSEFERDTWYLLYDVEGDLYRGEEYLVPTPDSAYRVLEERFTPA